MFFWIVLLLGFCLAAGPLSSAGAPLISPISQDRYVDVFAWVYAGDANDVDSDYDVAPDFGPFDSHIGAGAHAGGQQSSALAASGAHQTSVIGGESIQASGSVDFAYYFSGVEAGGNISATSKTLIVFMLTEESDYTLQGTLNPYDGRSSLTLDGPAGPVHEVSSHWQLTLVQESGTLPAGEYTFRVSSWVEDGSWGTIQVQGGSEYDVTLRFGPIGFGGPGGEVPDGEDVPAGPPLRVDRLPDDFVRLTWGPSCRLGDSDYAVYEGELGEPNSSMRVTCSTAGQLAHEFQPIEEAAWFIVVPTDGVTEGSYGDTGDGIERQPSTMACWPRFLGEPVCP